MGYICHHAIVVTTWDETRAKAAREKAIACGCQVTEMLKSGVNAYRTFLVGPDGSKEGWADSDQGDINRGMFCAWLAEQDGYFDWALVQYGDEGGDDRLLMPRQPS